MLQIGVFPPGLRKIEFDEYFNQTLKVGMLPQGLETLVFGTRFNQGLKVGVARRLFGDISRYA